MVQVNVCIKCTQDMLLSNVKPHDHCISQDCFSHCLANSLWNELLCHCRRAATASCRIAGKQSDLKTGEAFLVLLHLQAHTCQEEVTHPVTG